MADVQIEIRENGPLIVRGTVVLSDPAGAAYDLAGKETIALCRCGSSGNKPFCDGSHKTCGFIAGERTPAG